MPWWIYEPTSASTLRTRPSTRPTRAARAPRRSWTGRSPTSGGLADANRGIRTPDPGAMYPTTSERGHRRCYGNCPAGGAVLLAGIPFEVLGRAATRPRCRRRRGIIQVNTANQNTRRAARGRGSVPFSKAPDFIAGAPKSTTTANANPCSGRRWLHTKSRRVRRRLLPLRHGARRRDHAGPLGKDAQGKEGLRGLLLLFWLLCQRDRGARSADRVRGLLLGPEGAAGQERLKLRRRRVWRRRLCGLRGGRRRRGRGGQ